LQRKAEDTSKGLVVNMADAAVKQGPGRIGREEERGEESRCWVLGVGGWCYS
jgi:hypothetical protein